MIAARGFISLIVSGIKQKGIIWIFGELLLPIRDRLKEN